jgi:hypothetical protein
MAGSAISAALPACIFFLVNKKKMAALMPKAATMIRTGTKELPAL